LFMNNHADMFNMTIDPLKFLELNKSEFLFILTKEMHYSDEKALLKFDFMKDIIIRLKPLRACKRQTIAFLEETVQKLHSKAKSIMVNFLFKAIEQHENYGYAIHFLANIANRYQLIPIELKFIDEHKLLISLEQEELAKDREVKQDIPQPAENQTKNELPDGNDSFEKILSEMIKSENIFWKGLPMKKVVDHFIILTTRKNKNGESFLTNEQLISFLKKGFLNDAAQSKQKINCTASEKGLVIKRFYQLYDLAVAQYGYPAKKTKFIDLFTNCFDNWDKASVVPFFRPNKVKENW
jgi:hypothetical protein